MTEFSSELQDSFCALQRRLDRYRAATGKSDGGRFVAVSNRPQFVDGYLKLLHILPQTHMSRAGIGEERQVVHGFANDPKEILKAVLAILDLAFLD